MHDTRSGRSACLRGKQTAGDFGTLVDLGPGLTLIDLAKLESEVGSSLGVRVKIGMTLTPCFRPALRLTSLRAGAAGLV